MITLSWNQFDQAVSLLSSQFKDCPISGVFGVPRGGLCLAVALSHSLDVPMLKVPESGALIVDDVYETGRTLKALRLEFPSAHFAVWVSKCSPLWWHAATCVETSEWLLFPWENASNVKKDEQAYRVSRFSH